MTTTLALRVLPAVAVALGGLAGVLQWQVVTHRQADAAVTGSVAAASEAAVKILSYRADTVEQDLAGARTELTGPFLESYSKLVETVVIPGARQRKLSAEAKVTAAASVSADTEHAVALLFIDQTTTAGDQPPTVIPSTVRVTMDQVAGRWLVSGFDPV